MKKRKIYILYIFLILFFAAAFVAWNLFGPTVNAPAEKYFYIRTGSTYQQVKDSLLNKKIISGGILFDKVAGYVGYKTAVKPGRYKIDNGMSIINLIRMLKAGRQSPVNLVITKLRTKEDLAKKIGENFECDSLSVISFLNNQDSLMKFNVDTNTVMTIVIPNTYTLKWNNTPSRIFKNLFSEQQKFWTEKRKAQAAVLHLTEKEVYILASIVEEETNKNEDKGKIASTYINRLRTGMKLAADPTVKFAMKDFGLKRIMYKYLRFPSSYNTYLTTGLPPGPICTPSIKTIDAVLSAPETNYLYFVAKPDFSGYSNFTADYTEHQKNAKAYQQALDSLIKAKQVNENE